MVTRRLRLNRRGVGRTGCLVWLLVLAAVAYFGVEIGSAYLRYWRMLDEMQTQAQFAPSLTDDVIRRRLLAKANELALPESAKQITIRRTARPREIYIETSWVETLEFPFVTRQITFNPTVRERL